MLNLTLFAIQDLCFSVDAILLSPSCFEYVLEQVGEEAMLEAQGSEFMLINLAELTNLEILRDNYRLINRLVKDGLI